MASGIAQFFTTAPEGQALPFRDVLVLLTHSLLVGTVLALVTYAAGRAMVPAAAPEADRGERVQQLTGAASLLLLCVALTGVMLIINNNIVRAFALLAAITVVRFRVRLDRKHISASVLNVSLLFAVLGGVACGLGELMIGWTITAIYTAAIALLAFLVRSVGRG